VCVCVCVCLRERESVCLGGMCMLSVHLWSSTDQLLFSWWLWCVTYTSCYYRQHNRHITPIHTNMHIWSNPLHHSFSRQLCTHTHAHAHTNSSTHPQPREQLGQKCRIIENNRAASQEPHPSDQLSSSHNHHTTQSLQYTIAIPHNWIAHIYIYAFSRHFYPKQLTWNSDNYITATRK